MGKENFKTNIATIAFHRAINYGAVLQVYALQKKIEELGGNCTVLDYRNNSLESKHRETKIGDCKTIKDYIRFIILSKNNNLKHKAFRAFSESYLNLSKPYYTIDELKKDEQKYDKFITGSDQVWNGNLSNTDPAYFLDFVSNSRKKNSYAASFGFEKVPDNKVGDYYNMLKDYNEMSVRENQGAKIIKELLGVDVETVLDPTLLLTKEEWFEIAEDYTKNEKYILIYGFGGAKYKMNFAKNLSKKTGCKIVHIVNPYFNERGILYEKSLGPKEFLGIFKNAQYIVTNSFHGTAFAINFNKEFFVEPLSEAFGTNSRLTNILDLFGLKDRLIFSEDISMYDKAIDYDNVNKVLNGERKNSLEFIRKIINSN